MGRLAEWVIQYWIERGNFHLQWSCKLMTGNTKIQIFRAEIHLQDNLIQLTMQCTTSYSTTCWINASVRLYDMLSKIPLYAKTIPN